MPRKWGDGQRTMREVRPVTPHPVGTGTLLTDALIEQIAQKVEEVYFYDTACLLLGINERTYDLWLTQARRYPDTIYGRLGERVKQARARAEVELQKKLQRTVKGWQRYAWMLERGNRAKYGRNDRLDIQIHQQAQQLAQQYGIPVEELLAETQRTLLALPEGIPLQAADGIVEVAPVEDEV